MKFASLRHLLKPFKEEKRRKADAMISKKRSNQSKKKWLI